LEYRNYHENSLSALRFCDSAAVLGEKKKKQSETGEEKVIYHIISTQKEYDGR
jgi:hypothetical protein